MSGHSKWSTIKRKKGAADAKRGAVFTQVSKDIALSAREGGGDPEMNPALRLAIKKAKAVNMPAANIERAINKGTGNLPGVIYENYVYEGYGPGGVAIMMEVMTDNKNRTVPDIRHIMSKNGGNLGESGCVNWMFERKGIFTINTNDVEENRLMEILENIDIDDIVFDENFYELIIKPDDFEKINKLLNDKNINFDGEISLVPQNMIQLSDQNADKVIKLLELLDEHDDVQKVHSNFEVV